MRPELEIARQLIEEKQYERARIILQKAADDPTAQKWLEKLDEVAPHVRAGFSLNGSEGGGGSLSGWQYGALEVKRAYGLQYRFNGANIVEWKDQPIYYALNELGREGWELISFEGREETTVYILKKQGAALENKKADVWDQ